MLEDSVSIATIIYSHEIYVLKIGLRILHVVKLQSIDDKKAYIDVESKSISASSFSFSNLIGNM